MLPWSTWASRSHSSARETVLPGSRSVSHMKMAQVRQVESLSVEETLRKPCESLEHLGKAWKSFRSPLRGLRKCCRAAMRSSRGLWKLLNIN